MPRAKEFDPETVLDLALARFLERGYASTSIEDLVQATGLSRASLYNAFGDKQQLFDAVFDHYEARQVARLRAIAAGAGESREAIRRLLVLAAEPDEGLGCLVVNAGLELGPCNTAVGHRARKSFRGLATLFEDSVRPLKGVKDPAATGRVLEAVFLGLRVLRRTGESRARIERIANETLENLLPA